MGTPINIFNINNNIKNNQTLNINIKAAIQKSQNSEPEDEFKIKRKNKANTLNFNTGSENKFYISKNLSSF